MFFLHSLERLELKFGLSSEFFDKIPVRILLDVLFHVFRCSKASFCALTSSFMTYSRCECVKISGILEAEDENIREIAIKAIYP